MKCFLYARVSTNKGEQDPENQMRQLREYCAHHGWEIAGEYVDRISGSTTSRPALDKLMQDAARGKANVLLVWALDRLTRQGVFEAFKRLELLASYGVKFESLTEPHFRTTGPTGELMIAIAAWIAKQERQRLSERVTAGMARAKASGTRVGRPRAVVDRTKLRELLESGLSTREAATELGISKSLAWREGKGQG